MIVPGILVCSSFLNIVAHNERYSDCSRRESYLVEPLCYGVVKCVPCRHCRALWFVPVLRVCVCYVCCYVKKNAPMEGTLKYTLGSQAQHTPILWNTIHGLSNRAPSPTLNISITFNNKITTTPKYIANCL